MMNWSIGLGYEPTDFLCDSDSLPELVKQNDIRFEYNQWQTKDCTIYSAIWALSDLRDVEISEYEINELVNKSYTLWRIREQGWYVKSAVDMVAKRWNENNPTKKVAYYYVDKNDTGSINKIIDTNYTICTWYRWNTKYNKDVNDDWVLDWTEFGVYTYGHAINILKYKWKLWAKNSYKWRKFNYYNIAHNLSELKCWHNGWYVYTKVWENNLQEIKRLESLKTKCNLCIEQLWELRHLTNDTEMKKHLHYLADELRLKIIDCNTELKKVEE